MLRDSAHRYLLEQYSYIQREKILRAGGYSPEVWQAFAHFGWLGAALPEEAGGYGGGPEEAAILAEAVGRHLVLEPYIWTVVVGGALLLGSASAAHRDALLPAMVEGRLHLALAALEDDVGQGFAYVDTEARRVEGGWTLHGRKPVVPNGGIADLFFVSARTPDGVELFLVPRTAPGLRVRTYRSNDGQTAAELVLEGVRLSDGDRVQDASGALALLALAADHGAAAVCAEVVGSCAWLVETTCEYLKTREQYGAPLAKFQVLQHKLADMVVAVELARSMAHVAAAALGKPANERMREVSAARLQAIRCARLVGRDAVQMHGGMGMSQELDVSAHFLRLTMSTLQFGDEAFHLERMARLSA
ncbi:acyl-CoA dehydrogenase family protein [Hydrogenophaga sp. BPS33]|uniref:acyl-CoA dehydrogenase family protein n=1 Tax=Hydrogenophaga sp. BPS33 TaxID=2651974 RepID=UPI00131F9519|nr:acyl-CoA dehydrogenase family protein [Hydrogenophaga sp. BPS33]QHE84600.1 pimeloyl-CoA dehydrogenase small subunit [Hydrogenophaga sp. BPS33]